MRPAHAAALAAFLVLAGCGTSGSSGDPELLDPAPPAVRALLDGLTARAGSVPDQQTALAAAVDPAGGLSGCAAATSTVRFEPVWAAVRPAPQWQPSAGAPPAGDVYAVPTVLRIVRDGRIVGTDLATLHVGVHGGVARLAPFCLR